MEQQGWKWYWKRWNCSVLVTLYLFFAIAIAIYLVNHGETKREQSTSTGIGTSLPATVEATNVLHTTSRIELGRGGGGKIHMQPTESFVVNITRITIVSVVDKVLINHRNDIPPLLEKMGLKVGAELGVQAGLYSFELLSHWPSCTKLYLVDVWRKQKNYQDGANVGQQKQNLLYQQTVQRVSQYKHKVELLRMLTSEAAKVIPDGSLDFVYIDARHDYCGVMSDLIDYYPKVKPGGVLAGHDFYNVAEVKRLDASQDWGLCGDGVTRNEGAVKGAVTEFCKAKNITQQIYVTKEVWPSWLFIKS